MSDTPRTFAAIEEYRRYGGSPQNEPVFCSDMFELERELNIITLQRDTLAEALREWMKIPFVGGKSSDFAYARRITAKALAAVKGGDA